MTLHNGTDEEDMLLPDLTVKNPKECGNALYAFHAIVSYFGGLVTAFRNTATAARARERCKDDRAALHRRSATVCQRAFMAEVLAALNPEERTEYIRLTAKAAEALRLRAP